MSGDVPYSVHDIAANAYALRSAGTRNLSRNAFGELRREPFSASRQPRRAAT